MSPREKRHLTLDEFELAIEGIKIKPPMRLAAYRYMVMGQTFSEVSEISGLIDRSIQRAVRRIWARHNELLSSLPPGWTSARICLPTEEMNEIQERSKMLLEQYHALYTCK